MKTCGTCSGAGGWPGGSYWGDVETGSISPSSSGTAYIDNPANDTMSFSINNVTGMASVTVDGNNATYNSSTGKWEYSSLASNLNSTVAIVATVGNVDINITTSSTSWSKSKTVTITATSVNGFASGSEYKYALSTSGTTAPTSWPGTYTNGTQFTINKSTITSLTTNTTGTGTFYIWVKPLSDPNGVSSGNVKSAALRFDNTAPTVLYDPDGNTSYSTYHMSEVTVSDSQSGVNDSITQYYLWSQNTSGITTEDIVSRCQRRYGWLLL